MQNNDIPLTTIALALDLYDQNDFSSDDYGEEEDDYDTLSSSDYESDYHDDDVVDGEDYEQLIEFPETDSLKLIKDFSRHLRQQRALIPSSSSSDDEESKVEIPPMVQLEPLVKETESTRRTKRICLPRSLRVQNKMSSDGDSTVESRNSTTKCEQKLIEFPETDSLKLIKRHRRQQCDGLYFIPSSSSSDDEESKVEIPSMIQIEPLVKEAESTTTTTRRAKRICLPRSLRVQNKMSINSDGDSTVESRNTTNFGQLIEFPETDSLKLIKERSSARHLQQQRDDSYSVPSCWSSDDDEESKVGIIPPMIQLEPLAKEAESTTGGRLNKRICLPRSRNKTSSSDGDGTSKSNTTKYLEALKALHGDSLDVIAKIWMKSLTGRFPSSSENAILKKTSYYAGEELDAVTKMWMKSLTGRLPSEKPGQLPFKNPGQEVAFAA